VAIALARIMKANQGPQYKYVRQLFQIVIASHIGYATSIWHCPRSDNKIATLIQA